MGQTRLGKVTGRALLGGVLVVGAAAFGDADGAGVTATWTPTAAGVHSFTNEANWAGTTRLPTNAADTIHFAPDPAALAGAQSIDFPLQTENAVWTLGAFDGATNQTLRGGARNFTPYAHTIRLGNPNGFLGAYEAQDYATTWAVAAAEGFSPFLACVGAANGPVVEVSGEGTARIGRLAGGGLLQKTGTGHLAIDDVASGDRARTRIQANGGTLTLGWEATAARATLPVAAPAAWFDASRADTLTVDAEPDANGRRFVSEWRDAGGGQIRAVPFSAATRPFLSAAAQAETGGALVDFGAYRGQENKGEEAAFESLYGPPGALKLSEGLTGVREVFVVWADWTSDTRSCPFVLGSTGHYDLHRASGAYLMNGNYPETTREALHADDDTLVDGVSRPWTFGPYTYSLLTVASMNLGGDGARINTLGYDRSIRMGGFRLAEAILYTRTLTGAERRAVHAYLMAKWKRGGLALLALSLTADATVQVPDARTLDVTTLTAAGAVTKAGGGTLNVADVTRADTSLRVAAGAVSFTGWTAVDGTAPAAHPELWLDASAEGSLTAQAVDGDATGRAFISEWRDCRAERTGKVAVPAKAAGKGNFPFVVAGAANGRPVVDFGGGLYVNWGAYEAAATNGATYMEMPGGGGVRACEGFAVMRMKMPTGRPSKTNRSCLGPSLFSSYDMSFARYGTTALLSQYAPAASLVAQWWVDGAPLESRDASFNPGTNDFFVVNFSSATPLKVQGLAFDRWDTWGGVQIAETLLYTRPLAHAERAATMAYLRRKWQGAAPTERRRLGALVYEAGADTTLASDGPLAVARVALPDGAAAFTVTGGGTVTAGALSLGPDTGLVADGGALVVSDARDLPEAVYHFDASLAGSLETETTAAGETAVRKWKDVRGNGVYAEALLGGLRKAYPVLRTVETREGKAMPVVDFGEAAQEKESAPADTAAGMNIRGTDGRVQELHVVYSDAHENFNGVGHRFVFSDSARYTFHRGDADGQLFGAYYGASTALSESHDAVKFGYVGVDGVEVPWTWKMDDRAFHLVSAAPTNAVYVRTIAYDRGCRAGGSYQGELIAFPARLSPLQRENLQRRLMWKWFGTGGVEPAWRVEAAFLRVRNGGRLAFEGSVEVAAAALDGTGTVEAARVTGVQTLAPGDAAGETGRLSLVGALAFADAAELAFDFNGADDHDAVTVSGALALPASARVTLTAAPGLTGVRGRFPVVTAGGAVTGAEAVRTWQVAEENANAFSLVLEADAQGLWLVARPKGTVLLLR